MSFRRTFAMARKEFLHILRDPRSLVMALAMPALLLLMFGTALSLDVDRIPTLIYDADRTTESRELAQGFLGSRFFDVKGIASRKGQIDGEIDRNRILMGVSILPGYGRDLRAGRNTEVQILVDGSDSNTASIALGYAESLVQNYSFQLRRDAQNRRGGGAPLTQPAESRLRTWYNSRLESKNYIVPGLIAVVLMIIGALLTSLTIAREWEMGTMEQLLSTPVRSTEIVLGKMTAFFAVGLLDTAISVVVGVWVFEVPLRGSPWFLLATSSLFLFGAMFWGIFLSATARNQLLAFQLGLLSSFLPAFLLSGFVYAIESMPRLIQIITLVIPTRHFVTILKGIFLKGLGPGALWVEILLLAVFATVMFVAASRKLKQKVA